ncbi:unnamed protein product [Parajaminaea phylloscopi]
MTRNSAFPSSPLSRPAFTAGRTDAASAASSQGSGTPPWINGSPGVNAAAPSPPTSPSSASSSLHGPRRASSSQQGRPFRRASMNLSTSPTPNLIGSYSESLLSGRMSTTPSMPFPFLAELGVMGGADGHTPRHLKLGFEACFYALPDGGGQHPNRSAAPRSFSSSYALTGSASPSDLPTHRTAATAAATHAPYVGTIDLDCHYYGCLDAVIESGGATVPPKLPGYAVPSRGHIQLLIKNPHINSPVKLFLIPFDLRDMPAGTKTFIRQKIFLEEPSSGSASTPPRNKRHSLGNMLPVGPPSPSKQTLRYAVHLQFAALPGDRVRNLEDGEAATGPHRRKKLPEFRVAPVASVDGETDGLDPAPQIFLHKSIRVVFSPRPPDKEERLCTYVETPAGRDSSSSDSLCVTKEWQHKYVPYGGPGEDWVRLRQQARQARKEWRRLRALPQASPEEPLMAAAVAPIDIEASTAIDIPTRDVFTPNSDPNGERWVDEAERQGSPLQVDGARLSELESQWRNLAVGDHGVGGASSGKAVRVPSIQDRSVSPAPLQPVQRQGSFSPDQDTAATSSLKSRGSHSGLAMAVRQASRGALRARFAADTSSSRPTSPFPAPLTISTAPLPDPVTSTETVCGVTSPRSTLTSSPLMWDRERGTTSPLPGTSNGHQAAGPFSFLHKHSVASTSMNMTRSRSRSIGLREASNDSLGGDCNDTTPNSSHP